MKTENIDFAGMAGTGVNRAANRFAGNHSGLTAKTNAGMGPRQGNASDSGNERRIGPSVTRDAQKQTIATAGQGSNIGRGYHCPPVGNPDKINVGSR